MSENNHIFCKLGGYSYAVTVLLFFGGVFVCLTRRASMEIIVVLGHIGQDAEAIRHF